MKTKLLVICGPTATGKTALAVRLARLLGGELVSADSRQVYRELDIGTGKDRDELGDIPIHLYDVVSPDREFSVSQYVKLASSAVSEIRKRGKLPIIVGGTGLYIKALLRPFETIDIPPDPVLRQKLAKATARELQQMVARGDMNDSDWNNPRRLIRKIEIAGKIGHPPRSPVRDVCMVGLTAPMAVLDERIAARVKKRLSAGMEKEVASLLATYGKHAPAVSALGYRSLATWERDERAYARRQMTWFRAIPGIRWFDVTSADYPGAVTRFVSAWYTGGNL